MNDFFKKLTGDDKKDKGKASSSSKKEKGNLKFPFQTKPKKFSGPGYSLGGNERNEVVVVTIERPGPLGCKVEKTQQGGAVIATTPPGSQGEEAGLQRGDIVCEPGTGGSTEMGFGDFLALVRANVRPLDLEVKRVVGAPSTSSSSSSSSAEAFAKRQAVIAAAEQRNQAAKAKAAPISKVRTVRDQTEVLGKQRLLAMESQGPQSEAARAAVEAAKAQEEHFTRHVMGGFNVYEPRNLTSGQARNACTDARHGTMAVSSPSEALSPSTTTIPSSTSSSTSSTTTTTTPTTIPPVVVPYGPFNDAFVTVTSSSSKEIAVKSVGTLRKLWTNATTKGTRDEKFRRVRLSNPKIKEAIVDVPGALDLAMLLGFQLHEEDSETYLMYHPLEDLLDGPLPAWTNDARAQMERFEQT